MHHLYSFWICKILGECSMVVVGMLLFGSMTQCLTEWKSFYNTDNIQLHPFISVLTNCCCSVGFYSSLHIYTQIATNFPTTQMRCYLLSHYFLFFFFFIIVLFELCPTQYKKLGWHCPEISFGTFLFLDNFTSEILNEKKKNKNKERDFNFTLI